MTLFDKTRYIFLAIHGKYTDTVLASVGIRIIDVYPAACFPVEWILA